MIQKLESAINILSADEQARLSKHLLPVVEERKSLLNLNSALAAENRTEKELLHKRAPIYDKAKNGDTKAKAALQDIGKQLAEIRHKIASHPQRRIQAGNKLTLKKESFARHY